MTYLHHPIKDCSDGLGMSDDQILTHELRREAIERSIALGEFCEDFAIWLGKNLAHENNLLRWMASMTEGMWWRVGRVYQNYLAWLEPVLGLPDYLSEHDFECLEVLRWLSACRGDGWGHVGEIYEDFVGYLMRDK